MTMVDLWSASDGRDLWGYGSAKPNPHWPGDARIAVSFVVNFEEGGEYAVSDGDDHNEAVHEIEHRVVGLPDPGLDSHFEYGTRAGWWRIADVLACYDVKATVSACGRAVERLPLWPRTPLDAGTRSRPMAGGGNPMWA